MDSPGEFDVVASFQVVEHLADPLPSLEAACTLLRAGGLLVLSVPDNDSFLFDEFDPLNAPPHHMGRWTARALLWLQRRLPLRVVDIQHQPLTGDRLPARLTTRAVGQAPYRSFKHWLARRVLGEDRILALATPWVTAALELAPGHTVQVTYERLAG